MLGCITDELDCSENAYDDFEQCLDTASGFICSQTARDYIDLCEWDHTLAQAECLVKAAACATACWNPITRAAELGRQIIKRIIDWF